MRGARPEPQEPIDFWEPGEIPTVTHHHKAVRGYIEGGKVKGRLYDRKELKAVKRFFAGLLVGHRPAKPMEGPLSLTVVVLRAWRARTPKWMRDEDWWPSDVKPDCSNLIKVIEDTMAKLGYFKNDSQIAHLEVEKRFADRAGIRVVLEPAKTPMDGR